MDESVQKHFPKTELDEASRLLLRGADLIENHGHCKGAYSDGHRYCVLGALFWATGKSPNSYHYGEEPQALKDAVNNKLGPAIGNLHVSTWNDSVGRTKDEVVAKMRAAALGL